MARRRRRQELPYPCGGSRMNTRTYTRRCRTTLITHADADCECGRDQKPLLYYRRGSPARSAAVLLAKLLGTGSAAIFATDLSSSAIAAASVVAAGSKASIELCRGELLSAFRAGRADLVVCLPPYVASKRMSTADAVAKESAGAKQLADAEWVFLGGSDGLEVLGRLAADLVRVLSKTGFAFIALATATTRSLLASASRTRRMEC